MRRENLFHWKLWAFWGRLHRLQQSLETENFAVWFSVIKRVACASNAEKTSVRKTFVNHEGKKEIEVQVSDPTIYTVDYSWFFDETAKKIEDNVRAPEFIDGMTADFSTTTPVQKIVS